jgi:hypothetical protein
MSPIDDELRALLHSRAAGVEPAPDPLGGIESRARGLRRRRMLTTVSSAAAVVVAVAVAVPLLVTGNDTATRVPGGTPTATATVTATTAGALDPQSPWEPRGATPGEASFNAGQSAWERTHNGGEIRVLFAQTYGGQDETFWLGRSSSGDGLGHNGDVTQLPTDLRLLTWALPGDDGRGRLVVIAAPDARVEYSSNGNGNGYQQISDLGQAPKGVGLVPIEAEDPNDTIRVTEADGSQLVEPAPDWTAPAGSPPANLLTTWIHRGDATQQPPTTDVLHAFTQATGHTDDSLAHYLPLFDGVTHGVRYTIGQAYYDGDSRAHTFGYTTGGTSGPQAFLGPETPMDTELVALLVDSIPGSSTDLLVLVPRPGTGQLSYAPDATTKQMPVASGRSDLNGIGLVDRSKTASNDRIEQLDGDGNMDRPIYRGPVAPFLCAAKGCG